MEHTEYSSSSPVSQRRSSGVRRGFFVTLVILIAFAGGFFLGQHKTTSLNGTILDGRFLNKNSVSNQGKDIDFNLFWEVWETLKKEYVDTNALTDKKLFYGALAGLVGATGDPYSVFMTPDEANEFQQDLSGRFEGIGAEIGFRNDVLTIMAPIEDMPAMKAGVHAGDQIYAIDGQSAADLTLEEAIKKIRGPKGTQVKLTLLRAKVDKPLDITITRDTVVVKSIRVSWLDNNQVAMIKIFNFNDDTQSLFNDAIQEILAKKPRGLILDLRNNPGGYLDTAVAVASAWVPDGIIVSEKFGDEHTIEHKALGNAPLVDMPTVVLVNAGSASASEIVAGALKDHHKATLVGEKTFGKGSVQVLRKLSDGSVVKVTTAKWLTPSGTSIHEHGIDPAITVERTIDDRAADKDPQLDRALQELVQPKK